MRKPRRKASRARPASRPKAVREQAAPLPAGPGVLSSYPDGPFGRFSDLEFFNIARRLCAVQDLDALLREIGRVAEALTGSEASSLLLLDEDGRHLHFKTATGEKGQAVKRVTVPVDQGIAGWVARHWKPLIVPDVAKDERFLKAGDQESGFVTRSVLAVPLIMGDRLVGVCEAINKMSGAFSDKDTGTLQALANFAAVAVVNAQLTEIQNNFFTNTLSILTQAIEAHHPAYVGHPERVADLACRMGRSLGMDGEAYKDLYHAALLHDIGMIALNHDALAGQATLTAREKSVERLHTLLGYELLKGVKILRGALPLVRHHHEFWNGTGHPDGLVGEAIPLGARILCLIEHLEEIRFSGLKEPELSDMQLQMAKNGAGTKFDPRVVEAYLSLTGGRAS
jgi:hypothetical protein